MHFRLGNFVFLIATTTPIPISHVKIFMRKNHFFGLLFFCSLFLIEITQAQQLKTYSSIPDRAASSHYKCRVRLKNSTTWENAFVLQTTSKQSVTGPNDYSNGYVSQTNGWTASWIAFEFAANNEVEVEISKVNGKPIKKAMVRPVGDAKPALIRNGKAYVTFTKHANVNVDIDGQMEDKFTGQGYYGPPVHTITLFGNPIYPKPTSTGSRVKYLSPSEAIPTDDSWDTLCFLPGVHRIFQYDAITGNPLPFQIRSNKVINIPGDAVVHGSFEPFRMNRSSGTFTGDNWRIYGSGTISGEEIPHYRTGLPNSGGPFKGLASKIRLEGFVVADASNHHFNIWNKTDNDPDVNIFKNLKTLAWRVNTDGSALHNNTITTDCFFRIGDDLGYCCQPKSRIENCVVWIDHNGSMGVFATWFSGNPESNPYKNIKAIYNRRSWLAGGAGATSGIRFRDAKLGSTTPPFTASNVLVEDPYPAFGLFGFSMEDTAPNTINPAPVFQGNGIIFENFVQPNHANVNNIITGLPPHNEMKTGQNTGANDELLFSNITFKNFSYQQIPATNFTQAKFTGKAGANINFVLDCNNISSGGIINSNQTIGSATAADPIVGTTELNANGGLIEYVWVKSTTDSNPTLITGQKIPRATDAVYYPGILKQTTHFRRFARRAGCTDFIGSENSVTITVFDGGEISTNKEAFCAGNKPDILKNLRVPEGSGNVEYIWLKSTTGIPELVEDADTVANATGESLIFDEVLTTTTYFQRFARRPNVTGYMSSNVIKVMIGSGLLTKYYDNITATGTPKTILLENPSFKFNSSPQWKKDIMVLNNSSIVWAGSIKTDSANVNSIGHNIVGTSDITINGQNRQNVGTAWANGQKTLNIPLTQSVWYPIDATYKRTTGIDHQFSLNFKGSAYCPNPVCNNITNGGTISGNQEICLGATPSPLQNIVSPSGGTGSIEYIWVHSTTGCPASPSVGELIVGATEASYSPRPLTQTTYFRRFSRSAGCTDFSISSNCVIVEMDKTAPVFTAVPSNTMVTITSGSSTVVTYTSPTVSDNCGNVTVTQTGLASGSTFPVGVSTINYTATDALGNAASASFTITVINICQDVSYTTDSISLMRWNLSVNPVTSSPIQIPNVAPNFTSSLATTDGIWNIGQDRYITRVFGYIIAPITGNYRFNVTGDDRVEFYLSPTCSAQDTSLVSLAPAHTARYGFNKYASQTSSLIPLIQGDKYYFEVRHAEITGGDGWSLYWRTPTDNLTQWKTIKSPSLARLASNSNALNSSTFNINFSGEIENTNVLLEWVTNDNPETERFEIQRLDSNTGEYQEIDVIKMTGVVGKPVRFSMYDKKPIAGKNYYRIKMVGINGNVMYSPVEMVQFGKDKAEDMLNIYPNPTEDYCIIDLQSYRGKAANIYMYNNIGQQIQLMKIEKVGNEPFKLNVASLPTGNYLIRVTAQDKRNMTSKLKIIR